MTHARRCGPILVVDDDEIFRELLRGLLVAAGHEVRAVATGTEAAEIADSEEPVLAVLDVCLPDISGYEVCHRLRERWGDTVPILFVSGTRGESFDRVAGLLIGGDDYLVKPFASDELLARVASLLRRRGKTGRRDAPDLTPREDEVLRLIAEGLPNAEIAKRLVISPKTVGTHIEHIYGKLGVRSRIGALRAARMHE